MWDSSLGILGAKPPNPAMTRLLTVPFYASLHGEGSRKLEQL